MMNVRLRVVGSGNVLYEVKVDPAWTIREVKRAVEEETGIPVHEQRLCEGLAELPEAEYVRDLLSGESAELVLVRSARDWATWLKRLEEDGMALEEAPHWVKSDRKLIFCAMRQNAQALRHVAPDLFADRDFLLDAVEEDKRALGYLVQQFIDDRGLIFAAVQLVRAYDSESAAATAHQLVGRYPELAEEASAASPSTSGAGADDSSIAFALWQRPSLAVGAAAGTVAATSLAAEGVAAASGATLVEGFSTAVGAAVTAGSASAAAALAGAIALPLLGAYAFNQWVPGIPAGSVEVSLARRSGTCRIRDATALWITEEAWGSVYLYYYSDERAARVSADTWTCARILYDCSGYLSRTRRLEEVDWEGPAWPRSTIRKVAEQLNRFCMAMPAAQI